jgi:3-oxo-5-alpha-steroid 4-dehydrogenase 1
MFLSAFYIYLWVMIVIAIATFITLYFVEAGYGILRTDKWGKTISNKWAWFFMELPIFLAMIVLWISSSHRWEVVPLVFLLIFQSHYIQRTLIFPFLIKGKSRMPIGIMCMGISFNILNAMMQGYWIFHVAFIQEPQALFVLNGSHWFCSWRFILGACLFVGGYFINLRSDYIIRHLRKDPSDTQHYFPKGFMFNYVTSANYMGELIEWLGFAILTWSVSGLVFFIWTFANLVPRANAIHIRYQKEFPDEMKDRKLKRVIPFIY